MQLTLPLPPSDNYLHAYAARKGGKRAFPYRTKEYKRWRKTAREWLAEQDTEVLEGDVAVAMVVYFPTMAGDLTNRVKAAHDILQGVCYGDDQQVVHALQRRDVSRTNPRVEIQVVPRTLSLFGHADRRSGEDRRKPFQLDVPF